MKQILYIISTYFNISNNEHCLLVSKMLDITFRSEYLIEWPASKDEHKFWHYWLSNTTVANISGKTFVNNQRHTLNNTPDIIFDSLQQSNYRSNIYRNCIHLKWYKCGIMYKYLTLQNTLNTDTMSFESSIDTIGYID